MNPTLYKILYWLPRGLMLALILAIVVVAMSGIDWSWNGVSKGAEESIFNMDAIWLTLLFWIILFASILVWLAWEIPSIGGLLFLVASVLSYFYLDLSHNADDIIIVLSIVAIVAISGALFLLQAYFAKRFRAK